MKYQLLRLRSVTGMPKNCVAFIFFSCLAQRSTTQLRAQANWAFLTPCISGFVVHFSHSGTPRSIGWLPPQPLGLGPGSNVILTWCWPWFQGGRGEHRPSSWSLGMVWGSSVDCRWKACSPLCPSVGKGLVRRKESRQGNEKKIICPTDSLGAKQVQYQQYFFLPWVQRGKGLRLVAGTKWPLMCLFTKLYWWCFHAGRC